MASKISIALEDKIYEELDLIAREEKCSIEDAASLVIKKYINQLKSVYKPKLRLMDVLTKEESDEVERLTKCLREAGRKKTIKYYSQEIQKILDGAKARYYDYKSKLKESD